MTYTASIKRTVSFPCNAVGLFENDPPMERQQGEPDESFAMGLRSGVDDVDFRVCTGGGGSYVTLVEPSYMPATVTFQIDTGTTSCPVGSLLKWQSADTGNNRAVFVALLAAQAARQRIRIHFNDGDTACKGVFMHLLGQ